MSSRQPVQDSHELQCRNGSLSKGIGRRQAQDDEQVEGFFESDAALDRDAQEDEDEEQGLLDDSQVPAHAIEREEQDKLTSTTSTTTTTSMTNNNPRLSKQRRVFLREMVTETLPVFCLVLIGAILTGSLLERLQGWRVFIRIEELFILVPILLNLKGNLEMNLAARFSTSANIGELDLRRTRRSLILGNLALLQVQALIVSLLSGLVAFLLGLASRKGVHHGLQHPLHKVGMIGTDDQGNDIRGGYFEALLVLCVSMLAAGISSGVLGSFMCALVVVCRRFKINPDNVATPIASMLGDVVTLVILGGLASLFAKFMGTIISTLVFLLLLVAVFLNLIFTFRNAYVQELLSVGWGPLLLAMAISSGTGLVLETFVHEFKGFSLLAPIFTALSAAPASVLVARTSTWLHSSESKNRGKSSSSSSSSSRVKKKEKGGELSVWFTGTVLWGLGVGVMVLALGFGWVTDQVPTSFRFGLCYLVVASLQTLIGLVIAQQGSLLLWRWDYDPDVYALPLLSSFLDVSGQLLLVAAFHLSTKVSATTMTTTTAGTSELIDGVVVEAVDRLRRIRLR